MKEEFLHYIWKYRLFNNNSLIADTGDTIEVLNQGTHNFDAGPDFFNAKIKINNTVWAGNVEVHINSSDWFKHHHQNNKAYDNIILQVVYKNDKQVHRKNGEIIPTIELQFDQKLWEKFDSLIGNQSWIACQSEIKTVDSFIIQNWIDKLAIERLEYKSLRIKELLVQNNNSWESAFYQHLAANFGFKLNAMPFELLAKSLTLNYLAKHKNDLSQIEALLFGQAGFLNDPDGDDYYVKLKKEYLYLSKKFELTPLEKHLWKFLRSRPGNFPTIRIAQFASLIHKSSALFSKIIEAKKIECFYDLFLVTPSAYWKNHYIFNKESVVKEKRIGKSAVDILLINTVIPFLFVYGKTKGIYEIQDRAVELLESIKAESNSIVSQWNNTGIKSLNAFQSQALIQLKNVYCNAKRCLQCQIGNQIINRQKSEIKL